jgi:hypothetical protein
MSNLWNLGLDDAKKALVSAFIMGALLPVAVAVQTPGFDIFMANWSALVTIALNGAIVGFASELLRRFGTDSNGKFAGVV